VCVCVGGGGWGGGGVCVRERFTHAVCALPRDRAHAEGRAGVRTHELLFRECISIFRLSRNLSREYIVFDEIVFRFFFRCALLCAPCVDCIHVLTKVGPCIQTHAYVSHIFTNTSTEPTLPVGGSARVCDFAPSAVQDLECLWTRAHASAWGGGGGGGGGGYRFSAIFYYILYEQRHVFRVHTI